MTYSCGCKGTAHDPDCWTLHPARVVLTDAVTPNPGSDVAIDMGCTCAVLDNNHGRWAPWPANHGQPEGWWITAGCPVHAPGYNDE